MARLRRRPRLLGRARRRRGLRRHHDRRVRLQQDQLRRQGLAARRQHRPDDPAVRGRRAPPSSTAASSPSSSCWRSNTPSASGSAKRSKSKASTSTSTAKSSTANRRGCQAGIGNGGPRGPPFFVRLRLGPLPEGSLFGHGGSLGVTLGAIEGNARSAQPTWPDQPHRAADAGEPLLRSDAGLSLQRQRQRLALGAGVRRPDRRPNPIPTIPGRPVTVYKVLATDPHPYLMPGADPGEGFHNTNFQLFSTDDPAPGAVPTNQGFVINFKAAIASDLAHALQRHLAGTQPSQIMGMYTPELLPVAFGPRQGLRRLRRLVRLGPHDDHAQPRLRQRRHLPGPSGRPHQGLHLPQHLRPAVRRGRRLGDLRLQSRSADHGSTFPTPRRPTTAISAISATSRTGAAAGTLPAYTFLEPSWDATGNSQHPNYDVARARR